MKSIIKISLALALVFTIASCGKQDQQTIIGAWDYNGYVYNFNEDKTGHYDFWGTSMKFTYEATADTLKILFDGNTQSTDLAYKLSGDSLLINDSFGTRLVYIRK